MERSSNVAVWQYYDPKNRKWIEFPKRYSVTMERYRANVSGGRPCIVEVDNAEYKIDFEANKAVDTRNFHRWISIRRLDLDNEVEITHSPQKIKSVENPPTSQPIVLTSSGRSPSPVRQPSPIRSQSPSSIPYQKPAPPPPSVAPSPNLPRPQRSPSPSPSPNFHNIRTPPLVPPPPPGWAKPFSDEDFNPSCKLYLNHISSNSLSVLLLLLEGNVQHEMVFIDLSKGENQTQSFASLNPMKQVPVLEDEDGTVVWEPNSILRYICNTFSMEDTLYPVNQKNRIRCEMALDWRQSRFYPNISKVTYPALGFSDDWASVEKGKVLLMEDFQTIERYWLKTTPFICGNKVSIADYSIVFPLLYLRATDIRLPRSLQSYIDRFSQACDFWDEVTGPLFHYLSLVHVQ
eukprot:NODE_3289_length_1381_cov_26.438792_g2859_i0.p1 GENE.NODE_3289_length_1381_cov_26.438792_g2859_i0~~NODE_3289_length_1381_cov_26.438792_g2859_i0.p1  ORF type:complete len:404 (-),score=84.35 NODE_3289_length_1381_cov_26.438792_g2859_i0:120-1331(-)